MRPNESHAVGAHDADARPARSIQKPCRQFRAAIAVAEAARQNDGVPGSRSSALSNDAGDGDGRCRHYGEVDDFSHVGQSCIALPVADLLVLWVDGEDFTLEAASEQVGEDPRAHTRRRPACTEDGDGARIEQFVELTAFHLPLPSSSSFDCPVRQLSQRHDVML